MPKFILPLFASLMLAACATTPAACPCPQHSDKTAACTCEHDCHGCEHCKDCKGTEGKICHPKAHAK